MAKKLIPVIPGSGFQMDGYHIWCGSAICDENDRICLFASRWPKEKQFPQGYMTNSEIVLAVSQSPDQPFEFQKVLLGKREGGYWDSMMAHNPYITKVDNIYVLYYIGTPDGKPETRKIGYAWADSIEGPWHRSDKAIPLPDNANNPAVIMRPDGGLYLYYRDGNLKVSVAYADRFDDDYQIIRNNIFPLGRIEDMFVFYKNGKYYMLAEDGDGSYTGINRGGVLFVSDDGINWSYSEHGNPPYGFHIEYSDGKEKFLQRRERPYLFHYQKREFLLTSAKESGETRLAGGDTWNMIQEIQDL